MGASITKSLPSPSWISLQEGARIKGGNITWSLLERSFIFEPFMEPPGLILSIGWWWFIISTSLTGFPPLQFAWFEFDDDWLSMCLYFNSRYLEEDRRAGRRHRLSFSSLLSFLAHLFSSRRARRTDGGLTPEFTCAVRGSWNMEAFRSVSHGLSKRNRRSEF